MLTSETKVKVRFNEVDALKIVWHGHYINYFEDGRQDFGRKFALGYLNMYDKGFTAPIVESNVKHKSPLTFGDEAIIQTTYVNTLAAKIRFEYKIFHATTNALVAKGYTVQVFINNSTNALELYQPEFYLLWKEKWGII